MPRQDRPNQGEEQPVSFALVWPFWLVRMFKLAHVRLSAVSDQDCHSGYGDVLPEQDNLQSVCRVQFSKYQ